MSVEAEQNNRFGILLRQYIKESGLTHATLSEKVGEYLGDNLKIQNTTISAWCKGDYLPKEREKVIGLVTVLREFGGIKNVEQAQDLLRAWNYSQLTLPEMARLFPEAAFEEIQINFPELRFLFNNIWFSEREYGFSEVRNPWVGTLQLGSKALIYQGERFKFLWTGREDIEPPNIPYQQIQAVRHMAMPGGVNHNWVEVQCLNGQSYYFAEARPLGIGELIGGSHHLFQSIYQVWFLLGPTQQFQEK